MKIRKLTVEEILAYRRAGGKGNPAAPAEGGCKTKEDRKRRAEFDRKERTN